MEISIVFLEFILVNIVPIWPFTEGCCDILNARKVSLLMSQGHRYQPKQRSVDIRRGPDRAPCNPSVSKRFAVVINDRGYQVYNFGDV